MSGLRRVIVGTSGSPGSLRALRYAEDLARVCDATLIPVLTWTPPGGEFADRCSPVDYLRRVWADDASQRLRSALNAAWGETPCDVTVRPVVLRGEAGPALVDVASLPGDLLIVGTGRRGVFVRLCSGSVCRYCLAHAQCPVLAIPPPALAREAGHGLFRWAFWHQTITPDHVLRDRRNTAA